MSEKAAPLLGLVLAGGRSERLGQDKAAVVHAGKTLLEHAIGRLESVLGHVRIAIRRDQVASQLHGRFRMVIDETSGIGPAAGMLAAHAIEPRAAWLVLACDLPWVTVEDLERLVSARDAGYEATAFRRLDDGRPEPLCAIYEPDTLSRFQREVAAGGNTSPRGWLEACRAFLIDSPPAGHLDSINTPADLQRLRSGIATAAPPPTENQGN